MREYEDENIRFIEDSGIYYMIFLSSKIDLEMAKEIVQNRLIFQRGIDALLFVDGCVIGEIKKDAREYFGSDESKKNLTALAIYSNTVFGAFLGNFVIKVNLKTFNIPIKFFSNKEKAINWLKDF